MMTKDSIKQIVVKTYGDLAKSTQQKLVQKLFGCCDPQEQTAAIGKTIGYSEEELDRAPEGANLGVGCGNPSALADIKAGKVVVDLGSGAGFDAFIVAPKVGESGQVIGIDLSDDMLKLARKNARKSNIDNVQFVKGDIEALPLDEAMADHVISNCVINLSMDKAAVFQEAYRVLKPGGRLAISDIILERELPDWIKDSVAGHIACISGAEVWTDYRQYIEDAGFREIQIVSKSEFPIELMLMDPQLQKLAREFNLSPDSEQAKELASRVKSLSITAVK
ncbi:MAG: arsenite methyltransferase [Bacteroidota bacterium]